MSYATYELIHIPYVDNTYDMAAASPIEGFFDLGVRLTRGDRRNGFQFKQIDFNSTKSHVIKPNDRVIVRRVINSDIVPTDGSADLINGALKTPEFESSGGVRQIKYSGYDLSDSFMSALIFLDARETPINEALETALLQAASVALGGGAEFQLSWHPDNPITRSDGTAFPVVGERFYYKPLRELFTTYSGSEKTGDGRYYWYVNIDNQVVWRKETDVTTLEFDTREDDHYGFKLEVDAEGIRNFIIVRGGVDPEGKSIQDRYVDYVSASRHGFRYHIIPSIANNAQTLHTQDCQAAGVEHMRDASYPFTTTWVSSVNNSTPPMTRDSPVIAANRNDYFDAMRIHVRGLCRQIGRDYAESRLFGKLSVEIERPFVPVWRIGDNVLLTTPELRDDGVIVAKTMRVEEVTYGEASDTYVLSEDVGSV